MYSDPNVTLIGHDFLQHTNILTDNIKEKSKINLKFSRYAPLHKEYHLFIYKRTTGKNLYLGYVPEDNLK